MYKTQDTTFDNKPSRNSAQYQTHVFSSRPSNMELKVSNKEFNDLQSTFTRTFMRDNNNHVSQKSISKYLQCLDSRLSQPKFATQVSDHSQSPERRCSRLLDAQSPPRGANPLIFDTELKHNNSQERLQNNGSGL